MLGLSLSGDLDFAPVVAELDRLATLDLAPLAEEVRRIMAEENEAARVAGLDRDGVAVAPLRGGRPLTPSEQRRRGGSGPPLAPRGSGSRVVSGFVVEVVPLGGGAVLVRGSWPGLDWLEFHVAGTANMPARNPVGITPAAEERIGEAVDEFLAAAVGA